MHAYIDLIYDDEGNIAAIGGVWDVSDDFNREEEFRLFFSEWAPKQTLNKKGNIPKKILDKQYKAWQKWMDAKYVRIKRKL